jgi:hypothetical protein
MVKWVYFAYTLRRYIELYCARRHVSGPRSVGRSLKAWPSIGSPAELLSKLKNGFGALQPASRLVDLMAGIEMISSFLCIADVDKQLLADAMTVMIHRNAGNWMYYSPLLADYCCYLYCQPLLLYER